MGAMAAPHPDRIGWFDSETTQIDEFSGTLLEVAGAITDNDFNLIGEPISMIVQPIGDDWRAQMAAGDGYVFGMHTSSGLIDDIDAGLGHPLDIVDQQLSDYFQFYGEDQPLLFAGNSITFDRNWMRRHLPVTFPKFHYRSIDMTSVWQFNLRALGLPSVDVPKTGNHRALGDILDSIASAKATKEQVERRLLQPPF